ncbi:MAG: methionine biosynthesis protein MetW, partial [Ectothiorhodospira sp.]
MQAAEETTHRDQPTLAARMETGAREPGALGRRVIAATALAWSLFQLWIASPLPYWLDLFIVSETRARAIHLAFAVFLAFMAFPAMTPLARMRPLAGPLFLPAGLALLALAAQGGSTPQTALPFAAMGTVFLLAAWAALRAHPGRQGTPAADVILGLIPPGAGVLDLGCGDGSLMALLRRRGHDRVGGVEVTSDPLLQAVDRGFDVIDADLNKPLRFFNTGQFDVVVLSQTLQSVE